MLKKAYFYIRIYLILVELCVTNKVSMPKVVIHDNLVLGDGVSGVNSGTSAIGLCHRYKRVLEFGIQEIEAIDPAHAPDGILFAVRHEFRHMMQFASLPSYLVDKDLSMPVLNQTIEMDAVHYGLGREYSMLEVEYYLMTKHL